MNDNEDSKARKAIKDYNIKLPSMLVPSLIQITTGMKFLVMNRKYLKERVGFTDEQIDNWMKMITDIRACMEEDGLTSLV